MAKNCPGLTPQGRLMKGYSWVRRAKPCDKARCPKRKPAKCPKKKRAKKKK